MHNVEQKKCNMTKLGNAIRCLGSDANVVVEWGELPMHVCLHVCLLSAWRQVSHSCASPPYLFSPMGGGHFSLWTKPVSHSEKMASHFLYPGGGGRASGQAVTHFFTAFCIETGLKMVFGASQFGHFGVHPRGRGVAGPPASVTLKMDMIFLALLPGLCKSSITKTSTA